MTVIPFPPQAGTRAQIFVSQANPDYQAMVDRAKSSDWLDYRYDLHHEGIWVPLSWIERSNKGAE